ncbi:Ebp2-domain-containing protein [Durotheca rogersii]|uniref:Ebp2-domain-containing protein n=1 Tax=Durotheca rogersii TaxID=419775 RepID=UPI00222004FB|nr:Ebp2-domain-containing protein [Durotheca rogersii]KAI5859490.1 Ebp2-domain-containing protein [Durotheca rogersii]
MGKSKLKLALAAEKRVDFKKLKQKKKHKERVKKRQEREAKNGGVPGDRDSEDDDDDWEGVDEEDEDDVEGGAPIGEDNEEDEDEGDDEDDEGVEGNGFLDLEALDESDSSDSSIDLEEKIERPRKPALQEANVITNGDKKAARGKKHEGSGDEEENDDEEEDEEDIPLSDLEDLPDDEKEDLVPHSRLTINNTSALLASLGRIAMPTGASAAFSTHQSVAGAAPTADGIEDVQDDLGRELAFYAQSLAAAKRGRALLRAEGVPFSRPADYFAEMLKDDGHMQKVRAKLVEDASAKKAAAEARKLRDLKKFGKQVQVARLQERQKAKRETLDKIKTLKRKRQESSHDVGANEADLFDVGVDAELSQHNARKASSRSRDGAPANAKRQKKNEKYGFGGRKRHAKSGDALSSGDLSGFNGRGAKAGAHAARRRKPAAAAARPGKSRRNAAAARR